MESNDTESLAMPFVGIGVVVALTSKQFVDPQYLIFTISLGIVIVFVGLILSLKAHIPSKYNGGIYIGTIIAIIALIVQILIGWDQLSKWFF